MSATATFTGTSSVLTSDFYPPMILDKKYEYSCALLEFTAYNSIANVTKKNQKLYYNIEVPVVDIGDTAIVKTNEKQYSVNYITVPTGAYEFKELTQYLNAEAKRLGFSLSVEVNKNTLKSKVKSSLELLFDRADSIHTILGFEKTTIDANTERISEHVIKITSLNTISIECDIISGSYTNGKRGHSLYEFAPTTEIGYKIVKVPEHIVYLPVNRHEISSIQIRIVDQDGNLIDFRGEKITCRIHIKKE